MEKYRIYVFTRISTYKVVTCTVTALADLGGGVRDARPPLGVQILSISCSFRENLACSRPPWRVHAPPRENPGSATGRGAKIEKLRKFGKLQNMTHLTDKFSGEHFPKKANGQQNCFSGYFIGFCGKDHIQMQDQRK